MYASCEPIQPPTKNVVFAIADGAVGSTYAHCPDLADLLQMKRGVEGIFAEPFVFFIGQALYVRRKFAVELPEPLRREG